MSAEQRGPALPLVIQWTASGCLRFACRCGHYALTIPIDDLGAPSMSGAAVREAVDELLTLARHAHRCGQAWRLSDVDRLEAERLRPIPRKGEI